MANDPVTLTNTQTPALLTADLPPFVLTGTDRPGPVCVVCEHASAAIPGPLADLGLSPEHRLSHAVWDIGAADLASGIAERLNAPLLVAGVSRLVLDLNRPPEARDAMPELTEVIAVPGNRNLTPADRQTRAEALYAPFHDALAGMLDWVQSPVLVTVHSFTPVWKGQKRGAEIGLLHDADPALAEMMLSAAAGDFRTELNVPYSAKDGVTHTLAKHGTARGIPNVMIEVRNDLLADDAAIAEMADVLRAMIVPALERTA